MKQKIEKIIPSKLETGFQKWVYRYAPYLPKWVTPNMLTAIGAVGGIIAAVSFFMASYCRWIYVSGIVGIMMHIVTDALDGHVARIKNMTSEAGAFFDIMVDVCLSTFVLIALGLSRFAHIQIVVFAVPMYAMTIVTLMNYILYLKEFPFPRFGPIESQLGYIVIAIAGILFDGKGLLTIGNIQLMAADILLLIAMPFSYYELARMQIQLFRRLQKKAGEDA